MATAGLTIADWMASAEDSKRANSILPVFNRVPHSKSLHFKVLCTGSCKDRMNIFLILIQVQQHCIISEVYNS